MHEFVTCLTQYIKLRFCVTLKRKQWKSHRLIYTHRQYLWKQSLSRLASPERLHRQSRWRLASPERPLVPVSPERQKFIMGDKEGIEIFVDGACRYNGQANAKASFGIYCNHENLKLKESKRLYGKDPQTNGRSKLRAGSHWSFKYSHKQKFEKCSYQNWQ